jgi:hypothetical protein
LPIGRCKISGERPGTAAIWTIGSCCRSRRRQPSRLTTSDRERNDWVGRSSQSESRGDHFGAGRLHPFATSVAHRLGAIGGPQRTQPPAREHLGRQRLLSAFCLARTTRTSATTFSATAFQSPPPRRWRGKRSSRRLLRCRPIIGSRRSRRKTRGRRPTGSSTTTPKPARSGRTLWNAGITNHGGIGALVCSCIFARRRSFRKEEEFEPIDEWVKANQAAITALLKDAPKIQCIACGGDRQAPSGNPRAARGNRGRRADAQAM